MKRFITALAFSLAGIAGATACAPERPTHNAYVFSVYRREAMRSPFAARMNDYWKTYAGRPESADPDFYRNNGDLLRRAARRRGDRQMTAYMDRLDAYLQVSDALSLDAWDYPTRQELAARDSTLRSLLAAATAYKGRRLAPHYALLAMRANMLLGRDKANLLFWTSVAAKLPDGLWRDMCRNIYARALLGSGLRREACDIYAEQGDMQSISWCLRGYRNLAGIKKVYADDPSSPTLNYLVQDFVNNVQETIDSSTGGTPDAAWIRLKGAQPVPSADAGAFIALADSVLSAGKTPVPALWQSAAAMVAYLTGDMPQALSRARAAVSLDGTPRMKDNARCVRLLVEATAAPLDGSLSAWLTSEFRWLDTMITDERGRSADYRNHYADVKERIAYRVLAPRYAAAGRPDVALALYAMAEENHTAFHTSGRHADKDFTWQGPWPWNTDYASSNEYFALMSVMPADSLAAYYGYLTSAKTDVFEHYVASQAYARADYYADLIGTRYIAEGRFADAARWLRRVSLGFIATQNISYYMARRDFTVPRWFARQLPNLPDTDGPGQGAPATNLKLDFCEDMLRLNGRYALAPAGPLRDSLAYALAVRYYQASCYGDCWFLTHYARSTADSARSGELDFAATAARLLAESSRAADPAMQYRSLYALAFVDTDPWCTVRYDADYNPVVVPRPASSQYKALAALARFAAANPRQVDAYVTRCDVLRRFASSAE